MELDFFSFAVNNKLHWDYGYQVLEMMFLILFSSYVGNLKVILDLRHNL